MDDILKKINPGMFRTREEFLRYVAEQKEPLDIQLTNNYAFQKVFKNKKVSKGFLMALLRLKEENQSGNAEPLSVRLEREKYFL